MQAYLQQPIQWLGEKAILFFVYVKGKIASTKEAESQLSKLQKVTCPKFLHALGYSSFQGLDRSRDGYVTFEEFSLYFARVASAEESKQAFQVLNVKGDGKLTYGEWQSFQEEFEEHTQWAHSGGGKVGCPDFLEYAAMLYGLKISLTRNRFLEKVEAAGLALPVSDEWLEAEMEKEWLAHANFAKYWKYVINMCPVEEVDRRFPNWAGGFSVRDIGHEGMTVDDFCLEPMAKKASLGRPDILGLRLCTGGGYLPLNKSLRAHTHRFPVTQFCIDRALGRLARVGTPKQVFRGLRKKMHPRWKRLYEVYRGIGHHKLALVDCAFVSTTTDVKVAAGPDFGGPVAFQITPRDPVPIEACNMGFLCDGGSVSWVSQYPEEAEVLLPSNTILIPQLLCKHTNRRDPAIPKKRDVFLFHPFYPWDFVHNIPFVSDKYLDAANGLLLSVHRLDEAVVDWCRGGHPENSKPENSNPNLLSIPVPWYFDRMADEEASTLDGETTFTLPSKGDDRPFEERYGRLFTFLQEGWYRQRRLGTITGLPITRSVGTPPLCPTPAETVDMWRRDGTVLDSSGTHQQQSGTVFTTGSNTSPPLSPSLVHQTRTWRSRLVPGERWLSVAHRSEEDSVHVASPPFSHRILLDDGDPEGTLRGTNALRLAKVVLFTQKDVDQLEGTYRAPRPVDDHLTDETELFPHFNSSVAASDPAAEGGANAGSDGLGASGGQSAFPDEADNVKFPGSEWDPGRLNVFATNVAKALGFARISSSFFMSKVFLLVCLLLIVGAAGAGAGVAVALSSTSAAQSNSTNSSGNSTASPSPLPSPESSPAMSPQDTASFASPTQALSASPCSVSPPASSSSPS